MVLPKLSLPILTSMGRFCTVTVSLGVQSESVAVPLIVTPSILCLMGSTVLILVSVLYTTLEVLLMDGQSPIQIVTLRK